MSPKFVPDSVMQHKTVGAFSPVAFASGKSVFALSGQGAFNENGELVGSNIVEQTVFVFDVLQKKLAAIGASLEDVFKVGVFLQDLNDWEAFNEIYGEVMPKPYPARSAVGVNLLKGMLVEIDIYGSMDQEFPD